MKKQYVAYYRVSTQKQGDSGLGLEAQKSYVGYFAREGEIIAEFTEVASGSSIDKRIKLRQAIEMAKKSKAILIVAKADRLSRNVIDALQICDELTEGGTALCCCDMPDTTRFMLTVIFAFAEHERLLISIRTKNALDAKRRKQGGGAINGAPTHKKKTLEQSRADFARAREKASEMRTEQADDANKHRIEMIKQLRGDGYTIRSIADKLNKFGETSRSGGNISSALVHRLLKRSVSSQ